ncbi:MAG TPA: DUF4142 domain-containing protein [Kofleriaceae bacterium]|nr:DUF4142 domain-containing protein [Kofleriaceae bacterium]
MAAPLPTWTTFQRDRRWLAGALAGVALMACGDGDGDDDVSGTEAAEQATEDGEDMGASLAGQAQTEIGGQARLSAIGHIGAILIAFDESAFAQAEPELERGGDAAALEHAAMIRDEHERHAEDVVGLLAARAVAPLEGAVSGALRAAARAGADDLERAPRRDVDFEYLRLQVKLHAAGQVLTDRLIELSPDAALLDFLVVTHDAIERHRVQADALLRAR